jgi:hypothetical protein
MLIGNSAVGDGLTVSSSPIGGVEVLSILLIYYKEIIKFDQFYIWYSYIFHELQTSHF